MKIAFISDVHSAAAPFERALAEARAEGFDALVIMGDLLTYGPEPQRCLDLAADAAERDGALFLRGNHEEIYEGGDYVRTLPDWIRESVEWTRARIDPGALGAFDWRDEWTSGPLLVSHANPFGRGDWTHIRDEEDAARASSVLFGRGFGFGVFGHVHRSREYDGPAKVFTLGSIGQPRDRDEGRPGWAMGLMDRGSFRLQARFVDHGWDDQRRALRGTTLSPATVDQLCRFLP